MTSPKHNKTLHWGTYSHMYGSLTPEEIVILEEAIFARKLGRYRQARQLWDEKLPQSNTVPVLAIEKAELQSRLLRYSDSLDTLEQSLASQVHWRGLPSDEEVKLLTILAAAARIEAHGSLHSALLTARQMQTMFRSKPIRRWSLTEVRMRFHQWYRGDQGLNCSLNHCLQTIRYRAIAVPL